MLNIIKIDFFSIIRLNKKMSELEQLLKYKIVGYSNTTIGFKDGAHYSKIETYNPAGVDSLFIRDNDSLLNIIKDRYSWIIGPVGACGRPNQDKIDKIDKYVLTRVELKTPSFLHLNIIVNKENYDELVNYFNNYKDNDGTIIFLKNPLIKKKYKILHYRTTDEIKKKYISFRNEYNNLISNIIFKYLNAVTEEQKSVIIKNYITVTINLCSKYNVDIPDFTNIETKVYNEYKLMRFEHMFTKCCKIDITEAIYDVELCKNKNMDNVEIITDTTYYNLGIFCHTGGKLWKFLNEHNKYFENNKYLRMVYKDQHFIDGCRYIIDYVLKE